MSSSIRRLQFSIRDSCRVFLQLAGMYVTASRQLLGSMRGQKPVIQKPTCLCVDSSLARVRKLPALFGDRPRQRRECSFSKLRLHIEDQQLKQSLD